MTQMNSFDLKELATNLPELKEYPNEEVDLIIEKCIPLMKKYLEQNITSKQYNKNYNENNIEISVKIFIDSLFLKSFDNNIPFYMIIPIINDFVKKENNSNYIWKDSDHNKITELEKNNVGKIGELYINKICNMCNIPSNINGEKNKKIGGGDGDGTILDFSIEIKTAYIGNSGTYQHELGENPWKSKFMIFVDISPFHIWITIFPNFDESLYKSKERRATPFIDRKITWRKEKGAFKLDTNESININLSQKGNSIQITKATNLEDIKKFITSIIK